MHLLIEIILIVVICFSVKLNYDVMELNDDVMELYSLGCKCLYNSSFNYIIQMISLIDTHYLLWG